MRDGTSIDQRARAAQHRTAVDRCVAGFGKGFAYVALLVGRDLDVVWVSPSVEALTGWRPDQLVGATIIDLVDPDDLGEVAALLADELATPRAFGTSNLGASAVYQVRIRRADGGWQTVELASNNQFDNDEVQGIVVLVRDISERRLIDDVYDSVLAGAELIDTAGRIAELLSWQFGQRTVEISLVGYDAAGADEPIHVVAGREIVSGGGGATRLPRVRWIEGTGGSVTVHVDDDDEISLWFDVLVGRAAGLLRLAITRYVGEQQLRRQADEARMQRERAEGLSRALDEKAALMTAVSHDLSSPIAAIRIMSTLLDDSDASLSAVQRRQLVQRISRDALRTTKLLTDLTSIDRLLGGSIEPLRHRLSVAAVIARVLAQADSPDHRVVAGPDVEQLCIIADAVLVERLLDNLIGNAVKYTPEGSTITVGATGDPAADRVLLFVDDDGPGLPPDLHEAVFDAYVRGEDTTYRPGSGIGLFLVRSFALVQGGRAWYEASASGGARFVVALPRAASGTA